MTTQPRLWPIDTTGLLRSCDGQSDRVDRYRTRFCDTYLIRTSHGRYGVQKPCGIVLELLEAIVVLKPRVVSVYARSATRELLREEVAEPQLSMVSSASPGPVCMSV